jgi:hypothetical protein
MRIILKTILRVRETKYEYMNQIHPKSSVLPTFRRNIAFPFAGLKCKWSEEEHEAEKATRRMKLDLIDCSACILFNSSFFA